MPWYKRLRFRLIGSQLIVVLVGVTSMLLVTRFFVPDRLSTLIQTHLAPLNIEPEVLAIVQQDLTQSVDRLFLIALFVAAGAALAVGLAFGIILWSVIITPLREMAASSQRIADGRYDERVEVPTQAGEAMAVLATNFNQMATALEKVEETRMTLIGNVTHELRTPLSSLSGYVEGLNDGIFKPGEKIFRSMNRQISRLTRLINDIQILSRVESGTVELDLVPIDSQELVKQILFQLNPQLRLKEIKASVQGPDTALMILGDYDRTAQVLTNLLSNSIRYTPKGGKIEIELLESGLKGSKNCGRIIVKDNGIGIEAEMLPMIFERFFRADLSRSRDRTESGSGVGLTISRHLSRAMGGELRAESEGLGKGARFILDIPLA